MNARLGILGGSFNPVHNGHLRLAVEALEGLGLDLVELLPAPNPPHKPSAGLLPFSLRLELVRAALTGAGPNLRVNDLEGRRPGPSYSLDTLKRYAEERPEAERFFILGSPDLPTLPQWHRGRELPRYAHLAVLMRDAIGRERAERFIEDFWPGAEACQPPGAAEAAWRLPVDAVPGAGMLVYLPIPRLEISASDIRRRWREGRDLLGLTPEAVRMELRRLRGEVDNFWKEIAPGL